MRLSQRWIWLDGEFVPWDRAHMHVLSHHYGVGVFEGVRAYATAEGSAIFRLDDHTSRLFRSAKIMNIPIPYDKPTWRRAQQEIMVKNGFSQAYLRPLVFYGGEYLGLSTKKLTPHAMIAVIAWDDAYAGVNPDGITVQTSSLVRHHINSVFTKAKANGNYVNSILAMQEAQRCGVDDAILLDHQGCVAEGSGANFFMVRDGVLYTPPLTAVLEGITRETIITLAKDLEITVIEKAITRDEMYIADELFFTGTAVEVTPIRQVDGRLVAEGSPGPMTKRLREAYAQVVRGHIPEYMHWLSPVPLSQAVSHV